MGEVKKLCLSILLLSLAACQQQDDASGATQRIVLSEVRSEAMALPSPDTSEAEWTVAEDGRAIQFGNEDEKPLLSFACRLREDPPELQIIRHAAARPGQKALFPVLGNGSISRFEVDAELWEGEWAWVGSLPADDPDLSVFTGRRNIEATLPGRGTLKISGSRLPGEFIDWCRAGGQAPRLDPD